MLAHREFTEICDLVYRECGISLNEEKKKLVEARLSMRLMATGVKSAKEYLWLVKRDQGERVRFVDVILTKYTFFFREPQLFECLEPQHLSIWSAACSSGEEPYSIAIYCLERGFRPEIWATDLSLSVLEKAKKAIYPLEEVGNLSRDLVKRYFIKGVRKWSGYIRPKNDVRQMITFAQFNLMKDIPPNKKFNVIFCRNVLIYFDSKVRELVINRLYDALRWDGYLIIGGTESLNGIRHQLKYVKPSIYRKVKEKL